MRREAASVCSEGQPAMKCIMPIRVYSKPEPVRPNTPIRVLYNFGVIYFSAISTFGVYYSKSNSYNDWECPVKNDVEARRSKLI